MPKISELNSIVGTDVKDTDLLAIAHDVNGLPSTNKITFLEFSNAISTAVTSTYKFANSTSAGVIKVGDYLTINSTGYLIGQQSSLPQSNNYEGYLLTWDGVTDQAIWQALAPVYNYKTIANTNTYVVQEHDGILFVDPNNISEDITVILPIETAVEGKQYFIKNVDNGGQYKVRVTTQEGIDNNSNYIEDPVNGSFVAYYDLVSKGDADSWIHDGTVWRHITSQRAVPIFYTSQDTFAQVVYKNASSANNASSDLVGYNNEGNETQGIGPFVDMGINSNNYTDTTYGNIWGPSDSYVYNYGGNLIIGPQTDHTIKFIAGNTNVDNIKLSINSTSVSVNTVIKFSDGTIQNTAATSADSKWTTPNGHDWYVRTYNGGFSGAYDGTTPVLWFDVANVPQTGQSVRGAVVEYHAYMTGGGGHYGTIVGTIHWASDYGENMDVTHMEHMSGNSNLPNDIFWHISGYNGLYYKNTTNSTQSFWIQWTARVFYGQDFAC